MRLGAFLQYKSSPGGTGWWGGPRIVSTPAGKKQHTHTHTHMN